MPSVKSWYPVLGWARLPNFGDCHHLVDFKRFQQEYYTCDALHALEENISVDLSLGRTGNYRLVGPAGCGKTSFIYYLRNKAINEKNDLYDKYYCYIFNANKADHPEYEKIIKKEILTAFERMLVHLGKKADYYRIIENDKTKKKKEKINLLIEYVKDPRNKVSKSLIFVVDGVDLITTEDMVHNIASFVHKELDTKFITKLIVIRGSTYDSYSGRLKKLFDQLYPLVHTMPNISLSSITSYRITATNGAEAKQPFSYELCDVLLDGLYYGNKRASLGMLKAILEDNLPKGIEPSTSESFIQPYLERVAINTLLDKDVIPNVHAARFRITPSYPLALDILLSLVHSPDEKVVFGCVNDVARQRSARSSLATRKERFIPSATQFNYSMNALVRDDLVFKDAEDKTNSTFRLTNKGKVLGRFASRDHYHTKCKCLLPPLDQDDTYWDLMKVPIDFEDTMAAYVRWKDSPPHA